ncbi:hypothetical protein BG004_007275 [Podila humilis]|nr:hypothetical protein BG004_007275 [Podila humilis]
MTGIFPARPDFKLCIGKRVRRETPVLAIFFTKITMWEIIEGWLQAQKEQDEPTLRQGGEAEALITTWQRIAPRFVGYLSKNYFDAAADKGAGCTATVKCHDLFGKGDGLQGDLKDLIPRAPRLSMFSRIPRELHDLTLAERRVLRLAACPTAAKAKSKGKNVEGYLFPWLYPLGTLIPRWQLQDL